MNGNRLKYRALIQRELDEVQSLMMSAADAIPRPLREPVRRLINAGGKRLRPALVLLSSGVCGADPARASLAAAGVEMLHTATLIHDDFIDSSTMRRGVATLNAHWTAPATILTGDIVFALAAKLIARSDSSLLVHRFAETLETICVGEIDQMLGKNGNLPSIEGYYRRIYAKTASLFSLCVESGPILAGCSDEAIERGRRFGHLLGEAFQITDDVLDLRGTAQLLGKPVGTDLRQGLVTLPVLLYNRQRPEDPRVQAVLTHTADEETLQGLIEDLGSSGATERAMERARSHAEEARRLLYLHPDSAYRQALDELLSFAVRRQY
ncbi:MAG: polyprenyl synthetase family protein [Anaerolineae bacterium]